MLANVDESCEKIVASRKKIVKLNGGVFTYSKKNAQEEAKRCCGI